MKHNDIRKELDKEYGLIKITEGVITCTKQEKIIIQIPVKDIKVIGEFTTSDGPWFDDWFLVIITKNTWHEFPHEIGGIDELVKDLGKLLNVDLQLGLVSSTEWKTRIMYPEHVKDKDLYDIKEVIPETFGGKIKKLTGLGKTIREFSEVTLQALNS